MSNVFFISRQRLVGRTNGSSVYLLDLAQAVRDAGLIPHLIQPAPSLMGRMPLLRLRPEMSVFETHRVRGVLKLRNIIISCNPMLYAAAARAAISTVARRAGVKAAWIQDKRWPYAVAIPWTEADHRFVRRHARSAKAVIADYMFQAECFVDLPANIPNGIVMHDLFHAREGRGSDSVLEVSQEIEFNLLGRAKTIFAIQLAERCIVADALPNVEVILAPIAADPVAISQPGLGDRLLFVGSNTAPNVIGLKWFFDSVWPIVRAAWPEAKLDIAGTVSRGFSESPPDGVYFLGLVKDLRPLYREASIVISPLTFGSGLKIKLIEALAAGKAAVVTSVTLQGVEEQCSGAVALTDDPSEFAQHILRLHRDDDARAALADAALTAARQHFAPAACYGDFMAWIKRAVATSV